MSISARAELAGHDLEMKGFAADNAAERDRSVIGPACRFRRIESDRHAGWNFQGAGHTDEVVGRARRLDRAGRASKQIRANRVVIARLDNEEAAAFEARHSCGGRRARPSVRSLGLYQDGASP